MEQETHERKLVTAEDISRRLVAQAFPVYFDWLKQLVTLSSLELTVLLSLVDIEGNTPDEARVALLLTWVCLSIAVLAGVFACTWQYRGPLKQADNLDKLIFRQDVAGLNKAIRASVSPNHYHRFAARTTVSTFCIATISLCIYGATKIF
ncbi:MAG: hypothetical protein ACK4FF_05555 [Limnobacter sp.]|uniref:hypothetical protein n=1 Tax=Limnobacter sp. TaxID=2003368 RepID=UPI00391B58B5